MDDSHPCYWVVCQQKKQLCLVLEDEDPPEDLSDDGEDLVGDSSVSLDDQCFSEVH